MTAARAIGPIGTGARIAVGLLIVAVAVGPDYPSRGIGWWDAVAVLVLLPLISVGAAWVVNRAYRRRPEMARRARAPWSAAQAGAAAIVIGVVLGVGTALTFLTPMNRIAIFLFVGLSMVLAAVRGYAGCEILASLNLVLRRTDAIWCPLYTPIDSAEPNPDAPSAAVRVG